MSQVIRPVRRARRGATSDTTVVPEGVGDFIDPHADAVMQAYLASVLDWHSYIRFLMFPQDNPDVRITHLYVEPMLAHRWMPPEIHSPDAQQLTPALDVLAAHPRLVVLGDPGSGKSTLVNWIASHLAIRDAYPWTERFTQAYAPRTGGRGRLVPVPLILRDLPIGRGITWDRLVGAFLQHQMVRQVEGFAERLEDVLQRGQGFVLFDGLDEIGNVQVRQALRLAVFEGMQRYPACRWLLTSRIVGYDTVPFHRRESEQTEIPDDTPATSQAHVQQALTELSPALFEDRSVADVLAGREVGQLALVQYVTPFRNEDIYQFCQKWFGYRDYNKGRAGQDAARFYERLRSNPATLRLARTPHLLTMMALIFRARAHLPHGRALLYNEITQAYLESIDRYRGLQEGTDYPFDQKKRWLARVGFKAQLRRTELGAQREDDATAEAAARDILMPANDVEAWIAEAMQESGYDPRGGAPAFLDFVKRRSGLLLPRGADDDGRDQYAFLHLSLQEYFAACFLEEQMLSPRWLRTGRGAPGAGREDLCQYATDPVWRETLVFLFELLAARPGWPEDLAEMLFGETFRNIGAGDAEAESAAILLANIAADPHSGLPQSVRQQAIQVCCQWEVAHQGQLPGDQIILSYRPQVAAALFGAEEEDLETVWGAFLSAVKSSDLRYLSLSEVGVTDVSPLGGLTNLQALSLANTGVTDVSPLGGLANLQRLSLHQTSVTQADVQKLQNARQKAGLSKIPSVSLE